MPRGGLGVSAPPGALLALTCVHVAAVVAAEAAPASPAAADVPAPAAAPHVGGRGGLVVHGAPPHAEARVVLLRGQGEGREGSLGAGMRHFPKNLPQQSPRHPFPRTRATEVDPKFRRLQIQRILLQNLMGFVLPSRLLRSHSQERIKPQSQRPVSYTPELDPQVSSHSRPAPFGLFPFQTSSHSRVVGLGASLTLTGNLGPPLAGTGALFFLFCSMATGASGNSFSSAASAA